MMPIYSGTYWLLIRTCLQTNELSGIAAQYDPQILRNLEGGGLINLPGDERIELTDAGHLFLRDSRNKPFDQLHLVDTWHLCQYAVSLLKLRLWDFLEFSELGHNRVIVRKMISHPYVDWVTIVSSNNTVSAKLKERGQQLIDHCLSHYADEVIEQANNTTPFQKYMVEKIPYESWATILPKLSDDLATSYAALVREKRMS